MDTSKLGRHKARGLLRYFIGFVAVAIVLSVLLVFGAEKLFFPLILFGISFGATLAMVSIMGILYMILWSVHMILHHRGLWIRSMFRFSVRERAQASRQIGALEDPFLDKVFIWWHKGGMFLFKAWLVVYISVVVGYFVWHYFWPHG